MATLTKEECLRLDIGIYNEAVRRTYPGKKFNTCKYCGRIYMLCCICPEADADFQKAVDEIREVSEQNNREEHTGDVLGVTFAEIDAKFKELSEESRDWIKMKIMTHITEAYNRGKNERK